MDNPRVWIRQSPKLIFINRLKIKREVINSTRMYFFNVFTQITALRINFAISF